jgi:hypothetical protein
MNGDPIEEYFKFVQRWVIRIASVLIFCIICAGIALLVACAEPTPIKGTGEVAPDPDGKYSYCWRNPSDPMCAGEKK